MTGPTHKIGGFSFGLFFLLINSYVHFLPLAFQSIYMPFFIIGCVLGALFPDIDSPKSTISKYLWIVAWPIWLTQKIIKKLLGKKKSRLARNVCKTVGHRGIAHWLTLALAYIALILYIMNNETIKNMFTLEIGFFIFIYFIFGTAIGNLSHIVLDSFNKTGLPLLAPFTFKRFHFANVSTGTRLNKRTIFTTSPSENAFIVILLIVTIGLIIANLYTSGII